MLFRLSPPPTAAAAVPVRILAADLLRLLMCPKTLSLDVRRLAECLSARRYGREPVRDAQREARGEWKLEKEKEDAHAG